MENLEKTVNVLSLGAGVQSSALVFAYLNGLLKPMPDFAVFADTQAEPQYVYDWLEKLKDVAAGRLEIIESTGGDIVEDLLQTDRRFASIPFFIKNADGSQGMGRRQCTREYKVDVVKKSVRLKLGYAPRKRCKHKVNMILGISTDEAQRMRDNRTPWMTNQYPLINDLEWSRSDCIDYVKEQAIGNPPKSSCYICPYRSNLSWHRLKQDEPQAFEKAVAFEKSMQEKDRSKKGEFRGTPFLHRSCTPLADIDFSESQPNPPLFGNDCEGMCGV